jgi:Cdc6-like AAA superfamily ATPase
MLDVLRNWACGIEPPKTWDDDESSESSSEDVDVSSSSEDEDISSSSEDEDISSSSDNNSSPILWLHGPAGAGKSAIAQTLCQKLEEEGRLGASFFFKREHPSRGHAKRLFATIAYQLALVVPDLNRHISQSVETNPSLVDKSLSTQLRKLIVEPCQQSTSTHTLIVVIDGLDECEDQKVQQEMLCSIGRAITEQQLPRRPQLIGSILSLGS